MSKRFKVKVKFRRRTRPSVDSKSGVKGSGVVHTGFRKYPGPITIPQRQTLMMQFANTLGVTSNGSGIIAGVLQCDPSITYAAPFSAIAAFSEWTDIVPLFAQVKCVQLEIIIYPTTTDEVKGDILPPLALGGSLAVGSTPASYAVVIDNTDSQEYPILLDTTGRGRYHAIRHSRNLQFAAVSSPTPSTSIYAGCPGGIAIYGGAFPANTQIASVTIRGTYLLRCRV